MFEKVSHADIDGFLIKAAVALREQEATIADLRGRLALKDRQEHAEKIASTAVERGIMDETEADEYAQGLAKGNKDLNMVEEFVERTVAGVHLGSALTKTASAGAGTDSAQADVLTSFLLNNPLPE